MSRPVPKYLRAVLGLYLLWTGVLAFLGPEKAAMAYWVKGHAFLGGSPQSTADALSILDGLLRVSAAVLLAVGRCAWAAIPIAVCALSTLSLLFTNPVWMDKIGGFPAIGDGQSVIKALSLLGLAVWCWGRERGNARVLRVGQILSLIGIVWVFVWIGGMKFTLPEAQGIEPLVKSHPLMSWLYGVTSLQGVSCLIGAAELVTALCLLGWFFNFHVFTVGALLTVATFLTTLSFLVTLGGFDKTMGFPVLDPTGDFLIADVPMLLAAIVLWLEDPRRKA